jgi:hypothetical protein
VKAVGTISDSLFKVFVPEGSWRAMYSSSSSMADMHDELLFPTLVEGLLIDTFFLLFCIMDVVSVDTFRRLDGTASQVCDSRFLSDANTTDKKVKLNAFTG